MSIKKYAFILMGAEYDPKTHTAEFNINGNITNIFTVRDFEEAKKMVLDCYKNGYGCLEVCGAFGEDRVKELIKLTNNEMAIGFVTHFSDQDKLFNSFFG